MWEKIPIKDLIERFYNVLVECMGRECLSRMDMRFGNPRVMWLNRSVGRATRVDANVCFGFTVL